MNNLSSYHYDLKYILSQATSLLFTVIILLISLEIKYI